MYGDSVDSIDRQTVYEMEKLKKKNITRHERQRSMYFKW